MKKPYFLPLLLFFHLLSGALTGQQFLNGSFENAALPCGINLVNDAFNDNISGVIAFGEKSETDILSQPCGYGNAVDGDFFLALYAKEGITDAIALELSEPLVPGRTYNLEFYEKIGEKDGSPVRLAIGMTPVPTAFGELLYTVFEPSRAWTKRTLQFSPPLLAKYLTVIVETGGSAWLHVDNFSLVCPEVQLGNDTTYCDITDLTLATTSPFDRYLWSDGSTGPSLLVQEPGTYWLEASSGACTSRDSIELMEIPYRCNCRLYTPNVFSPNNDGNNDGWLPSSPCELTDYQLRIFDRWGNMVYETTSPTAAWDGRWRDRPLPSGNYIYQLRYRFPYFGDEEVKEAEGTVLLLR